MRWEKLYLRCFCYDAQVCVKFGWFKKEEVFVFTECVTMKVTGNFVTSLIFFFLVLDPVKDHYIGCPDSLVSNPEQFLFFSVLMLLTF